MRPSPLLFGMALLGCGSRELPPRGQVLLHVTTDALLPSSVSSSASLVEPAPLFDHLRIEVLSPDAKPCDCERDFVVDREQVDAGLASFGVVSPPGRSGYVARIRLYLKAFEVRGEPMPRTTLETFVALPAVAEEGIRRGHVILRTNDVGRSVGTAAAPVPWSEGPPSSGIVGSWEAGQRVPCRGVARDGEACVPGGAFWMGRVGVPSGTDGEDDPQPRLVRVSPFFLDRTEVTVGAMRASGLAAPDDPALWSGLSVGVEPEDYCTYSDSPGARESFPVNCTSRAAAQAYCRARGGDLPTEAQFEYAAGALRGQLYVWGSSHPDCVDAVFARGGGRGVGVTFATIFPGECRAGSGDSGGPLAVGSGRRDRLALAADSNVVDLAGNVMEYARDNWNRQTEPCWQPSLLEDPVCETASTVDASSVTTLRGGGWMAPPYYLSAAFRRPFPVAQPKFYVFVGFRCVRPD